MDTSRLTDGLTDGQLVEQVREKDKELYAEIVRRYQAKLAHYLRKFIRDSDDLEDVLQDVFIKAYRNLYGFDARKKFSPWLYRIAHNEAMNHLSSRKKIAFSLDEKEFEAIDKKMDINADFELKEFKAKIEEGLGLMKSKYREPLLLHFFEEKTYEEISEIVRIPRNTVGVLIMRGKNILKQFLKQESYGAEQ